MAVFINGVFACQMTVDHLMLERVQNDERLIVELQANGVATEKQLADAEGCMLELQTNQFEMLSELKYAGECEALGGKVALATVDLIGRMRGRLSALESDVADLKSRPQAPPGFSPTVPFQGIVIPTNSFHFWNGTNSIITTNFSPAPWPVPYVYSITPCSKLSGL